MSKRSLGSKAQRKADKKYRDQQRARARANRERAVRASKRSEAQDGG